jgi:hypothetical protein
MSGRRVACASTNSSQLCTSTCFNLRLLRTGFHFQVLVQQRSRSFVTSYFWISLPTFNSQFTLPLLYLSSAFCFANRLDALASTHGFAMLAGLGSFAQRYSLDEKSALPQFPGGRTLCVRSYSTLVGLPLLTRYVRQCIIALVRLRLTLLGPTGRWCRHSAVQYRLAHEAVS